MTVVLFLALLMGVFFSVISSNANVKNVEGKPRGESSLLVIGTSGVRWGSLNLNDPGLAELKKFFATATLGNNLHYTGTKVTCPIAGWLTLSATDTIAVHEENNAENCGKLADSFRESTVDARFKETVSTELTVKPEVWQQWQKWALSRSSNPQLGTLAQMLAAKHVSTSAVGPGGAVVLMDNGGRVGNYWELPNDGHKIVGTVSGLVQKSQLVVLDLSEKFSGDFPAGAKAKGMVNRFGWPALDRQSDVSSTKTARLLNSLIKKLPPAQNILLVDIAEAGATPHLGLAAYRGPGFNGGVLTSKTIRQQGLIHTVDLSQTILQFYQIEPKNTTDIPTVDGMLGASVNERQNFLMKQAAWADIIRMVQIPFYIGFGVLIALALGFTIYLAVCRYRQKTIVASVYKFSPLLMLTCILYFSASYILCLLPFSLATGLPDARSSSLERFSEFTLIAYVVGISLLSAMVLSGFFGGVAKCLQRRFGEAIQPGFWALAMAAIFTYFTISVSVFLGAPDQLNTVVGSSGLSITRFFGMNNAKYTFLVCSLMVIMLVGGIFAKRCFTQRGNSCFLLGTKSVMIALLVLTVLIDGFPTLGADVGGPLALIVGVLLLYYRIWEMPLKAFVFVRAAGYAILSTVFFALVDYSLPGGRRTHLGGFVKSLLAGQGGRVIFHKLQAVAGSFIGSGWALIFSLVLFILFVALVVLLSVFRKKSIRANSGISGGVGGRVSFGGSSEAVYVWDLLIAGVSFALLAAVTNDSGALIIGCAMAVIIPTVGLILNNADCELPHK